MLGHSFSVHMCAWALGEWVGLAKYWATRSGGYAH